MASSSPTPGGKDVFVHISAVEKAGLSGLPEGAKVSYDIVPHRGREFGGKSAGEREGTRPPIWRNPESAAKQHGDRRSSSHQHRLCFSSL